MLTAEPMALVGALLLVTAVFLSKTSARWGVPSLVLFLLLGMAAGSEGLIGIEFDNFDIARDAGVLALAFILFSGGLSTKWSDVRSVVVPGVGLATVGTLTSALLLGSLAAAILDIGLLQGMLLGAVIASTDAAAVFAVLRSRGVALRNRLRSLLELESGSNDPAAVLLTIGIISLIQGEATPLSLVGLFAIQMSLGLVAGWGVARGAVALINRLNLESPGLYPVMSLGLVLLTYEGTTWLGGSGFLAAYVAGLVMAKHKFLHKHSLTQFHDSVAWLMQIAMFVLLGLLVFPSHLLPVAGEALLVAILLTIVARPISVLLTLAPFRMSPRELALVSWVGLRGAAPIILATFPVVEGIRGAETIFNVVFFVVITSVLVQGATIPMVARRLGLAGHPRAGSEPAHIPQPVPDDLAELTVAPSSAADGSTIMSLDLPPGVLIVMVRRDHDAFKPEGSTRLQASDRLLIVADSHELEIAKQLLQASH